MNVFGAAVAGLAAVGGLLLLWWRTRVGKELALMQATRTSSVAEAAKLPSGTLVELKGTVRCQAPLMAEFSQLECVYHLSLIDREYERRSRDSSGRTQNTRSYENVRTSERHAPCVVEDATGTVRLNFEGAKVEAVEVVRRYESDVSAAGLAASLLNIGSTTLGYRYTETIIPPGIPVYVLGSRLADGSVGASSSHPFVISHKSEEQRTKDLGRMTLWLMVGIAACFAVAAGVLIWSLTAGASTS
jgi:hypothetical protein